MGIGWLFFFTTAGNDEQHISYFSDCGKSEKKRGTHQTRATERGRSCSKERAKDGSEQGKGTGPERNQREAQSHGKTRRGKASLKEGGMGK